MDLQNLTLEDYWDIAVRRKWLIIASILLSLGVAWALCLTLPKSYRSNTVILVENQKIPENYVSPAVSGSISERLTMIQQQVLSRTVVGQVIDELNLYSDGVSLTDRDTIIEGILKAIKVETRGGVGSRIESFSISFAHGNPKTAMQVTEKLASQFIDENLKAREVLVKGTTEFLEEELTRAKASLEEQEHAIAEFKKKYMGELPGQTSANLQTLDRLQKDLAVVNQTLQDRIDRRTTTQKMINAYGSLGLALLEASRESLSTSGNESSPHQGGVVRSSPGRISALDPLAARLKELERTLTTLSAEYRDTYPDVIQVKKEIAQVKAELEEKYAAVGREIREDSEQIKTQQEKKKSGPTVSTVDPYLHELKREREENEIAIPTLKEQQRRLSEQIREYELRVERAPEREQELIILERDYDNTKKNYQALLEKELNARISENLEKRQKGEKFRILDPANLPTKPESPNRVRIMLAGLVLGCGLGYGAAFAMEQVTPTFRRPEDVEAILGLPLFATIPDFQIVYQSESTKLLPSSPRLPVASTSSSYPFLPDKAKPNVDGRRRQLSNGRAGPDWLRPEMNLLAKWRPRSVVAEQFRVAATRLALMSGTRKSTVVVVTSAVQGEGKSSTTGNLGYVLAQDLNKATLLMDCDFKRPVLNTYIGVKSEPGLVDALYGDQSLDSCLHRIGESSLWVLPSGNSHDREVGLAKIHEVAKLLTELRLRFDYIIVDAPPILPLADMNVLASMADILTLVVRAQATRREVVQKALKTLPATTQAGVVLTGLQVDSTPYYMQQEYYLGSDVEKRV